MRAASALALALGAALWHVAVRAQAAAYDANQRAGIPLPPPGPLFG
jgi:hypothetical protein